MLGSCSLAICGGVNVLMDPQLFVALSKARMLSPTGQCKTFTNEADGYARGEGCGIVILKKLKEALQDGNKIWATIKTGTNQDGRMMTPITAPSGIQQENLIENVFKKYGVDKSKINVIEAHGTGTPVGDPTEVYALGANFGKVANAQSDVYIGSVKTNIGHLEAAAGVAGLIKILLMMKNETIVPSLWYTKGNENPKLNLSEQGFLVPTKCVKWFCTGNTRRIACVNSFGFGGTNAHAIVEQYAESKPVCKQIVPVGSLPHLVALSAFDKDSLVSNVQHLFDNLKLHEYDLVALSCTSTCKRDHRTYRKAIFGRSQDEILGQCSAFLNSKDTKDSSIQQIEEKRVIFVFCGVGTAWNGMCKSLMMFGAFKKEIANIDTYLKPLTGWVISKIFSQGSDIESDPMVAHIAIFACQVGLVALWSHYGIKPDVLVGQSVGEVAAAYVAGIIDLQAAVKVIYNRAKCLAKVVQGQMAVVRNINTDVIQKLCDESKGSLHLSVFQSPLSCTVSGMESAIQTLKESLKRMDGVNSDIKNLDVQCAYHSPYVEEASKQLVREVNAISVHQSHIPIVSSVTGKLEADGWLGSADYWKQNVRQPVKFGEAIKSSVSSKSFSIFIEIGPSPVLRAHISNILTDDKSYAVFPSIIKRNEIHSLSSTLCNLYGNGLDLKWSAVHQCQTRITEIPIYQLRKYKQLYQSPTALMRIQGEGATNTNHMYITQQPQKDGSICFKAEVDEKTTQFVFQHVVTDLVLLPGAFYADIGFEIGRVLGFQRDLTSVSLEFLRPVKIENGKKTVLKVTTFNQKDETLFHVKYNQITMCKGWVYCDTQMTQRQKADIESIKLSIIYTGSRTINGNEIYGLLGSMGFQYGSLLRLLDSCITNGDESLTSGNVPMEVLADIDKTTIHPCILDAMMQTTILATSEDLKTMVQSEKLSFFPVSLGQINVLQRPKKKMFIYTKRINSTLLETVLMVHYNILLMSSDGTVVANVKNYYTYAKRNAAAAPCELSYRITWHPFKLEMLPNESAEPLTVVLTSKRLTGFEPFVLKNESYIFFRNEGNTTYEKYTELAFSAASKQWDGLKNVDAVMLLIGTGTEHDIQNNDAECLLGIVKDNCMLLTEIVKSMTKHSLKASLYVITQHTQETFPIQTSPINIIGGELWGFVRSVYMEYIYGHITLVDLQSSNIETPDTLRNFIKCTCGHIEHTKAEVVIFQNKLYGAQFTKVPKKEIIPALRDENQSADITKMSYKVFASISQHHCSAVMSPLAKQLEHSKQMSKDFMSIRVKCVSVHPISIFPRTTGGKRLEPDIWQEPLNDDDQLFGLEYLGYQVHTPIRGKGVICKSTKFESELEDADNQWEIVVLYPAEIFTEMSVPRDCKVCLKDIPFYQPGLLLYATLSWQIVDIVQKNSSVVIYCTDESELPVVILRSMLKNRKNCYILDLSRDLKDTHKLVDVLITLENLDSGFFLLQKCKTIICIEESISNSVKSKVTRSGEQNMKCIRVIDSLARKQVSKLLPKVVSWLQKHYPHQIISKAGARENLKSPEFNILDEQCKIPCPTIDIMNAHQACLPVRNHLGNLFVKSGAYIVTGGLTGLGWELVLLISDMGAGCVVTMSRRRVTDEMKTKLTQIERKTGCKCLSVRADVTDFVSVQKAMDEIQAKLPKSMTLKGIFHGAGVVQPELLVDLDEDNVEFILKPKVLGTLNMHVATKTMNLDYFVVSSSINSLIGSPGQCSYGAANAFLDAFMEWRRRNGLAGQSIKWGALAVGMALRPAFNENFSKRGFNLLSVLEIRSCFQQAMMQNSTCIVFANINWDMFARDFTNPKLARIRLQMSVLIDQMLSIVVKPDNDGNDNVTFNIDSLKLADEATQILAITKMIEKVTSKVTAGDVSQVITSHTLAESSFDSMSTVTFINVLHDITGYRMDAAFMMNLDHSLDDIINILHIKLFRSETSKDDGTNKVQGTNEKGASDKVTPVENYKF